MIRGTTPTLTFTFELDNVAEIWLTFSQKGKDILTIKDGTYADGTLAITLTQEQSLLLGATQLVDMQLKAQLTDGNVVASTIIKTPVNVILNDEVM